MAFAGPHSHRGGRLNERVAEREGRRRGRRVLVDAVGAGRYCLCLAQEVIVDRQGGTHQRIITSSLHIMMRMALALASNTNPRAVRPVGRRGRPGGCAPW